MTEPDSPPLQEFLVEIEINVPPGIGDNELEDLKRAEAARAAELAATGNLCRIWRPDSPGWRNVGLWRADDQVALEHTLASLPLHRWMTIAIRPLQPHPSDPS